jgi:hypothetical protein
MEQFFRTFVKQLLPSLFRACCGEVLVGWRLDTDFYSEANGRKRCNGAFSTAMLSSFGAGLKEGGISRGDARVIPPKSGCTHRKKAEKEGGKGCGLKEREEVRVPLARCYFITISARATQAHPAGQPPERIRKGLRPRSRLRAPYTLTRKAVQSEFRRNWPSGSLLT